jgi:hypothetical protein
MRNLILRLSQLNHDSAQNYFSLARAFDVVALFFLLRCSLSISHIMIMIVIFTARPCSTGEAFAKV